MKSNEMLSNELLAGGQPRRRFLQGLGATALAIPMLGFEQARGDPPESQPTSLDEWDDEIMDSMACHKFLWCVDRQASLVANPNILSCNPCDCAPHDNLITAVDLETNFEFASDCDELGMTQVNITSLKWLIRKRFIRLNGPCGTPVGTFDGRWFAFDPNGTILISGQLAGTLGFDPCADPGLPRCCEYPKVMGILAGVGRQDTTAEGCIARWTFCGKEGPESCQIDNWDVGITGLLRCRCT